MKILLSSHYFSPRVGGIETASLLLAREFTAKGHEVRIVTSTTTVNAADNHGFPVLRAPNRRQLAQAVQWCDVFFHNNISLQTSWPLLCHRRPWIVTTQTWIARSDGTLGWREHLKRALLRYAHNVAISSAIAGSLPTAARIIPNCYDDQVFSLPANAPSPCRDLIFVGRLVSDKGADTALAALAHLKRQGLTPSLTIVGDGPDRSALEAQAVKLGLSTQVTFIGTKHGAELAKVFRDHKIQLVPSRWAEPFGIVALEGAACGCFVLGSNLGGLADAIGPCGATFPNRNEAALVALLKHALQGELPLANTSARQVHLERHRPSVVASRYLDLFTFCASSTSL